MARISLKVTSETKPSACVECGHVCDHASGPDRPQAGDFSLCIRCASLNVFTADGGLRAPTVEEMCQSAADSELRRLRNLILAIPQEPGGCPAPQTKSEPTS